MSESKTTPRVAILGASRDPDRYSHRALTMLREGGYDAVPIHPALDDIDGVPVAHSLAEVEKPVDTLTLYVNPNRLRDLLDDVVELKPRRVIFNPGTESTKARSRLEESKIKCIEACTLVLLRTKQF